MTPRTTRTTPHSTSIAKAVSAMDKFIAGYCSDTFDGSLTTSAERREMIAQYLLDTISDNPQFTSEIDGVTLSNLLDEVS